MLIAINVGRSVINFGLGYATIKLVRTLEYANQSCSGDLLDWVLTTGYGKVIAGAFIGVLLANNLALLPFMWKGKAIRRFMTGTPLARLHQLTATTEESA